MIISRCVPLLLHTAGILELLLNVLGKRQSVFEDHSCQYFGYIS
jgi:hypothetical protein